MKIVKSLFLASLLLPLLLVAEERRTLAGTCPMSEEAKAHIEAEKKRQAETEDEWQSSGFIFDRYPPVYYSSSHHWLAAVTILDDNKYTVEIEDGSVWKINSYDGRKALNWCANDPLMITQNNRWFSSFGYRIVNKANGTSIEANIFLTPVEKGEHTRYITHIDRGREEIFLSDDTCWEVSYLDTSLLKDWAISHMVIIGTNSSWDSASEGLLINANLANSIRVKQKHL